jgi:hypothetical protein
MNMFRLNHLVTDPRRAWDASRLAWDTQVCELSEESRLELNRTIQNGSGSASGQAPCDAPTRNCAAEVRAIKKRYLDDGYGFVIIDGFRDGVATVEEAEGVLVLISRLLGQKLMPQNKNGDVVKNVMDMGTPIGEEGNGRYSESREGGNLHTDGAEHPLPAPTYLPLFCLRTAKAGGCTQLVSAYELHNHMLTRSPELLASLYDDFYWDRRGDLGPDGQRTCIKPVFSYDSNRGLQCSYLRKYIEQGHKLAGVPLSARHAAAFDAFDALLDERSPLIVGGYLKPGQMLISNNLRTLHGRTGFEDHDDPNQHRLMLRTWVL